MNYNPLPPRTADTMSEAIALSSPSGRMSKRARAAAEKRLSTALFGPSGLIPAERPKWDPREKLLHHAKQLRELAARGMSVRKFTKEAERIEAEAAKIGNPLFDFPRLRTLLSSRQTRPAGAERERQFLLTEALRVRAGKGIHTTPARGGLTPTEEDVVSALVNQGMKMQAARRAVLAVPNRTRMGLNELFTAAVKRNPESREDTPIETLRELGLSALRGHGTPYVFFTLHEREAAIRTQSMTANQWANLTMEKVRRIAVAGNPVAASSLPLLCVTRSPEFQSASPIAQAVVLTLARRRSAV